MGDDFSFKYCFLEKKPAGWCQVFYLINAQCFKNEISAFKPKLNPSFKYKKALQPILKLLMLLPQFEMIVVQVLVDNLS